MRRLITVLTAVAVLLLSVPALVAASAPSTHDRLTSANDAGKIAVAKKDEIVTYNTKSGKYHCVSCSAARRCTRNCIDIKKSEAIKQGGVACKICGGSCE